MIYIFMPRRQNGQLGKDCYFWRVSIPTEQQREMPCHLKAVQPELSPGFCSLKVPLRQDSFDIVPFLLGCVKSGEETSKPEVLGCGDKSVSPLDGGHSTLRRWGYSSSGNFSQQPVGYTLATGLCYSGSHSVLSLCPLAHTQDSREKHEMHSCLSQAWVVRGPWRPEERLCERTMDGLGRHRHVSHSSHQEHFWGEWGRWCKCEWEVGIL